MLSICSTKVGLAIEHTALFDGKVWQSKMIPKQFYPTTGLGFDSLDFVIG